MIVSRQNAKLKTIRRLRKSKGDKALLEGPHLVAEALAAGIALENVFLTPELADRPEGRELVERAKCDVELVEPALLAALMDADTPQGALAVAHLPRGSAASLPHRRDGIYVYLDGVQDPGNLGAIARVAEAAAAVGLACGPGTADPHHPRALRASAGSLLRLPTAVAVAPEELRDHLAALKPTWIALVAHGGRGLYEEPIGGTLVLALGAEGAGLSPAAERLADHRLRIPTAPPVESLNVATAAAVVLFELRRRRTLAAVPA
ncbi:MAG TPA: RNA methyltransferase [Thermoanaerobaculia bacterium]|jgi:TrmH family RNA methyltransferase|nr:RNA methyltransferase [Thermoanaerobaculia bacterium]